MTEQNITLRIDDKGGIVMQAGAAAETLFGDDAVKAAAAAPAAAKLRYSVFCNGVYMFDAKRPIGERILMLLTISGGKADVHVLDNETGQRSKVAFKEGK